MKSSLFGGLEPVNQLGRGKKKSRKELQQNQSSVAEHAPVGGELGWPGTTEEVGGEPEASKTRLRQAPSIIDVDPP
jgi:hypothetical protein